MNHGQTFYMVITFSQLIRVLLMLKFHMKHNYNLWLHVFPSTIRNEKAQTLVSNVLKFEMHQFDFQ